MPWHWFGLAARGPQHGCSVAKRKCSPSDATASATEASVRPTTEKGKGPSLAKEAAKAKVSATAQATANAKVCKAAETAAKIKATAADTGAKIKATGSKQRCSQKETRLIVFDTKANTHSFPLLRLADGSPSA